MEIKEFKKIIWKHYGNHKRNLPWRKTRNPYKILVSEIMLQQTQVARVIPRYRSFLRKFPDLETLASAPLSAVLLEWQGLGYNRRALYLKQAAEKIIQKYSGKFPKDLKLLTSLPGIGRATAGDILAFAWNIPSVFIETNIRSVFIHFFFEDSEKVSDQELLPLIEETLDTQNPREWYWALFDYGTMLKETGNPSRKSSGHKKQSAFKGSNREMRSKLLKLLLSQPLSEAELCKAQNIPRETVRRILASFLKEGLIAKTKNKYSVR